LTRAASLPAGRQPKRSKANKILPMKQIVSVALMMVITAGVSAQQFRLNTYGTNSFDESFNYKLDPYNYYSGKIYGGLQVGAGLEYLIQPQYCVELMYLRHSTHAPTTYRAGAWTYEKTTDFDVTLNYFLIGLDGHLSTKNGKLEAYGGVFQGIMVIDTRNPVNGLKYSSTKYDWSTRLGGNFWITKNVGIKLQTQLLVSIQPIGGKDVFTMRDLDAFSTILQLNVGGGLTFKLGK